MRHKILDNADILDRFGGREASLAEKAKAEGSSLVDQAEGLVNQAKTEVTDLAHKAEAKAKDLGAKVSRS